MIPFPRYPCALLEDQTVRRLLAAACLVALCLVTANAADPPEDTPKAAATRKIMKNKVSFTWKSTPFGDVVSELKDDVKGLRIHVDNKGGINNNKPITYSCKDKPLDEVLDDLLGKNGWGYFIKSKKGDAYDGDFYIRLGNERGYEGIDGTKKEEK
jgi:hypothetical protein